MSLVAIVVAELPHSFKQDCMRLVKRAKVALPFELTTCSHLLSLISHSQIKQRPGSVKGTFVQASSSFCLGIFDGSYITSIARKQSTYYADTKMSLRLQVGFSYSVLSLFSSRNRMPWKDHLEEKYGESFRPWTEEDLQQAIGNIIAAIPHNRLTTIVSLIFLTLLFRF